MYSRAAFIILVLTVAGITDRAEAQNPLLVISQAPGGIPWTIGGGGGTRFSSQFGTMNALAIGAPATGVTATALANGALYFTTYRLTVLNLPGNHLASVTGAVTTNFANTAALTVESCPSTSTCTSAASFSAMSTNAGAPTTIIPSASNQTLTAGLGIFLPDNDGATRFTGTDTARLTLTVTDLTNGHLSTVEIRLDTPLGETVQDAVQLTLGTATGGLTVSPSADFAMNFGIVNGLGINPAAGLTATSVAGGALYSTPYLLQPAFTDFLSTTATIKVFVSTDFAHPLILQLQDSAASGGPFTAISKLVGTPTQITTSAADRGSITRFLGLFVSSANGATAFTGSDNATLTFTLTVP